MDIGSVIKEFRKEKGVTQVEMAKAIGISQTSMSQVEKNVKSASKKHIIKMAAYFGVAPQMFYILSLERKDIVSQKRASYDILFPVIKAAIKALV